MTGLFIQLKREVLCLIHFDDLLYFNKLEDYCNQCRKYSVILVTHSLGANIVSQPRQLDSSADDFQNCNDA